MKKYLFFAMVASATLAFTSCGTTEPEKKESVKMRYSAREIAVDDEIKAEVIVNPSDAKLTYYSSDTEVASVTSFGLITGKSEGVATIYVEAENIGTDSMTVYVLDASQLFKVGGMELWNWDLTEVYREDSLILTLIATGEKYTVHCKACPAMFFIWDSNQTFNGKNLAGKGYWCAVEEVPIHFVDDDKFMDGKYNGAPITYDYLIISEKATKDSLNMVKPGRILDVNKWADLLDDVDTTLTLNDCVAGPQFTYIDWADHDNTYYSYRAFLGEGLLYNDDQLGLQYRLNVGWLHRIGYYGLEAYIVEEGDKQQIEIARPAKEAIENVYYEQWDVEEQEVNKEEAYKFFETIAGPRMKVCPELNKEFKVKDRLYKK
ncbi:MAG: Ig-like domain-containing protein [Paludibacteraceae bacterium]|nr:Ig-like domain-containing protein [Paludibacteraceae bacterium]